MGAGPRQKVARFILIIKKLLGSCFDIKRLVFRCLELK